MRHIISFTHFAMISGHALSEDACGTGDSPVNPAISPASRRCHRFNAHPLSYLTGESPVPQVQCPPAQLSHRRVAGDTGSMPTRSAISPASGRCHRFNAHPLSYLTGESPVPQVQCPPAQLSHRRVAGATGSMPTRSAISPASGRCHSFNAHLLRSRDGRPGNRSSLPLSSYDRLRTSPIVL